MGCLPADVNEDAPLLGVPAQFHFTHPVHCDFFAINGVYHHDTAKLGALNAAGTPADFLTQRLGFPFRDKVSAIQGAAIMDYFTGRLTQAPEDAEFALAWVVKHARTREEQDE